MHVYINPVHTSNEFCHVCIFKVPWFLYVFVLTVIHIAIHIIIPFLKLTFIIKYYYWIIKLSLNYLLLNATKIIFSFVRHMYV